MLENYAWDLWPPAKILYSRGCTPFLNNLWILVNLLRQNRGREFASGMNGDVLLMRAKSFTCRIRHKFFHRQRPSFNTFLRRNFHSRHKRTKYVIEFAPRSRWSIQIAITYKGLFSCQNVWSSVIHGLEGCGCANIGSYSTYVSKYDFKFSTAVETFILVRVKLFRSRATC